MQLRPAARKAEAEVASLVAWRKLGPNHRFIEPRRVEVRRCMLRVIHRGLVAARHHGKQLRLPMRQNREGEVLDLVIQRILAHGIHPHHAVWQIRRGPRRLQQDADIADGRIYLINRPLRMHRRAHTQSDHDNHSKTNTTQAERYQYQLLHHFGARRTRTHTTDAESIASAQPNRNRAPAAVQPRGRSVTRERWSSMPTVGVISPEKRTPHLRGLLRKTPLRLLAT